MARFQVYRLRLGAELVVDLQTDLLSDLKTRLVAPLYRVNDTPWSMARLNPRFLVDGETHVMMTQRMASIQVRDIGEVVADLSGKSDVITAAMDFLFQGF